MKLLTTLLNESNMTYERLEPKAKEMIDKASIDKPEMVVMMVDWFQTDDEALILRDMLWYARDNGVTITIIPKA